MRTKGAEGWSSCHLYNILAHSLGIDGLAIPLELAWPSMLAVNKDRRGVANWGLNIELGHLCSMKLKHKEPRHSTHTFDQCESSERDLQPN